MIDYANTGDHIVFSPAQRGDRRHVLGGPWVAGRVTKVTPQGYHVDDLWPEGPRVTEVQRVWHRSVVARRASRDEAQLVAAFLNEQVADYEAERAALKPKYAARIAAILEK